MHMVKKTICKKTERESIEWQRREAQEMERRKSKTVLEEQRVKVKNKLKLYLILFFTVIAS